MSVEKLGELNKLAKLCGLEDDKSLIGQLKLYAALPGTTDTRR